MKITYFDVETQNLFQDLGMTNQNADPSKLRIALAGTLSDGEVHLFEEKDAEQLIRELRESDLIVGHNVLKFDYGVISAYTSQEVIQMLVAKTFDTWKDLLDKTGCMVSLEGLCMRNIGMSQKTTAGLKIPQLWREGKVEEVKSHLSDDLKWTEALYQHGKKQGQLIYEHKEYDPEIGKRVSKGDRTIKVNW